MSEQVETTDEAVSRTRPIHAVRRASNTRGTKKVTRYTLDLDGQQHMFLRMFALQNEVEASKVMRTMLYFLESDRDLANRVLDEIFGTEAGVEDSTDDSDAVPDVTDEDTDEDITVGDDDELADVSAVLSAAV